MKKFNFLRWNRTPIQCIQAINLYVKTTKRAMLTLLFSADNVEIKRLTMCDASIVIIQALLVIINSCHLKWCICLIMDS